MSALNQKTIKKNIFIQGVGLHSGLNAELTIKPAEPNTGILFKRTDIPKNNIITPNLFNVSSAVFCTTISNEDGISVSTIEHLMGALYGLGIDNAMIEINNQEVPILDGSAKTFVEAILDAGIQVSNAPIKIIKIDHPLILTQCPNHSNFLIIFTNCFNLFTEFECILSLMSLVCILVKMDKNWLINFLIKKIYLISF